MFPETFRVPVLCWIQQRAGARQSHVPVAVQQRLILCVQGAAPAAVQLMPETFRTAGGFSYSGHPF